MMTIRAVGLVAVVVLGLGPMVVAQNPPKPAGAGVGGAPGQVGSSPNASGKRAMTFADLMAMKRVSDPQISPSGRWVLFSVTDVDLEKNTKTNHLWVVPMDGSAAERQVTTGPGESFGRFSPDGTRVSYTQNPGKGESFARIVVAAWDEKAGTLGAAKALTGISGDADGAVWSPDAKRLMLTTQVWPECSVSPTHDDGTVVNGAPNHPANPPELRAGGAPGSVAGIEISGTRDVAAWRGMQPATWAEEDACDRAKDEAAEKNPVKAQVWDGLLYRHWDQFTGAKRTHIVVADVPTDANAGPSTASGMPDSAQDDKIKAVTIRDVTTARDVGDAETPTWMLGGPQEYAWAPDSKEIAYVTNLEAVPAASTNNDVFTLRVDDPNAKPVKRSTSAGSDDEPEYSPDGRWLAFRSQRQAGFESDRERLMLYDRANKSVKEITLALKDYSSAGQPKESELDRWVDEFTWGDDSKHIWFAAGDRGEEPIYETNITGDDLSRLGKAAGEWSEIRPILANGRVRIVGSLMKADRPTEIAVADPLQMDDSVRTFHVALDGSAPTKETTQSTYIPRLLTHLNDAPLSELDLGPIEPFWFTGAEGTKVEGFLLKPPGFDPKKKYPLKFIMHGGPQTMAGDSWSYRWNWELMAASGYVVIGINRRGSTGYGQKFVDEVSGDWGGRAYEDLMKGLDYAEAKYLFIDKTRECALGASYGGFMADWVLTHTNRFKCIVTHDGLYDAGAAWGATEEMWFPEWEFRRPEDYPKGWDGFTSFKTKAGPSTASGPAGAGPNSAQDDNVRGSGHAAEPWRYAGLPASEDPFRKWSPKEYIQNAKTPTLIIHSQKDYRLDVSQGFELYTALQRQGVASRFLYFPDEGHWVLKPRDSELWNAVVSDWCDRWTKSGKYADK